MSQLMMWWSAKPIENYELPEGFSIRTYREGDASAWIRVCADGLDTGTWTEEDFVKKMLEAQGIQPEGIFFVIDKNGEVAGTATGVLKPDSAMGYLHMVCISPKYRGRNLAKPLNAAVLKYLVENGRKHVTLHTDDFRIPAIKTYLSLGFRPILYEDNMLSRWQNILKEIGIEQIESYTVDGMPGPVIKAV